MKRWKANILGSGSAGAIGLALAVLGAGCASQEHAAATLSRLESEPKLDALLSQEEQAEVVAAMKSVAADHQVSEEQSTYVREMRWSDIPAAVGVACDQPGVEMVVLDQTEHPWGTVFRLLTVEDRPATLEVRRTHDERMYEASAAVGRFNFEKDKERAQRLLEEIDRAMERYAEKKRLPEGHAAR